MLSSHSPFRTCPWGPVSALIGPLQKCLGSEVTEPGNGTAVRNRRDHPSPAPFEGFPGGSDGTEPARNAGDPGWFDPWVGKILWSSKWQNLLQYSCLENSMTEEPGWLQSVGSQKVRHA